MSRPVLHMRRAACPSNGTASPLTKRRLTSCQIITVSSCYIMLPTTGSALSDLYNLSAVIFNSQTLPLLFMCRINGKTPIFYKMSPVALFGAYLFIDKRVRIKLLYIRAMFGGDLKTAEPLAPRTGTTGHLACYHTSCSSLCSSARFSSQPTG